MRHSILKTCLVLVILHLLSNCAIAQPNALKDIRKILDDQTISWNRGDLESFMKDYWKNDSLIFVGKKRGNIWVRE